MKYRPHYHWLNQGRAGNGVAGAKQGASSQPCKAVDENEINEKSFDLRYEHVSMRYDVNFPLAIRDLDLHIPAGLHVGVCGPSGAGKSSLISMLMRMTGPTLEKGAIKIGGEDILHMPVEVAR